MAVNAVGAAQQVTMDPPTTPEDQQAIEAAFATAVMAIALPMVMRQMSFSKQTVDEVFAENQQ
jgi:hypothetical protein